MYGQSFFQDQQTGSMDSAGEVVPLVLALVKPKSVIDVGCGIGTWLAEFKKHKVKEILGIDGAYINPSMLKIPENNFLAKDINKPLNIDEKFDLVVCLEVAEHLPEKSAKTLVSSLTKLGPVIMFSAAIPLQEGTHHINKQWQDYWAKLFSDNDYVAVDCIRRKIWNNDKVEWWYAQNIIIYVKKRLLSNYPLLNKEFQNTSTSYLSLVHPKNYLYRANFIAVVKSYIIRWLNSFLDKIKLAFNKKN